MEKHRFRSLPALSLFAVTMMAATTSVGCGQQAGAGSEPIGHSSQALSTGLVVSAVYGGGSNTSATYDSDYVEIFNRGATPVPLAGMSLQYAIAAKLAMADAGPSTWTVIALPATAIVQPGQYFLVRVYAPTTKVGAALPTPDYDNPEPVAAAGVGTNFGNFSGIVAIVSNTTPIDCGTDGGTCMGSNIVDLMSYGAECPTGCGTSVRPTVYEGSGPAPRGSSVKANLRKDGGCTETDDNANDFELVSFSTTVVPRNTATATHLCSLDGGLGDAAIDGATDAALDSVTTTEGGADAPADSGTPSDTGMAADTGMTTTDAGADTKADSGPADTGTAPTDTGTAPTDTGTAPTDTGSTPDDTGSTPDDTGSTPDDTGTAPSDSGAAGDTGDLSDTGGATDAVASDSGCGCRVTGESETSSAGGALAALAIASVLARRRRR